MLDWTARNILLICIISLSLNLVVCRQSEAEDPLGVTGGALGGQDIREFYELEKKLTEEKPTAEDEVDFTPIEPEEAQLEAPDFVFPLKEVVTDSSGFLSETELGEIFSRYEGNEVSIKDLLSLVEEINDLYKSKEIATAKAFLPVQKIIDGIVRIKLLEARYGDIEVKGNETTRESYILRGVGHESGDLVEIAVLRKTLLGFNAVNDINLKASLNRGKEGGETDLQIIVQEPPQFGGQVYIDNAGAKATGEERLGVLFTDSSLLGYRDLLSIGGNVFEGGQAGHIGYQFPFLSAVTRLGGFYDIDKTEIIDGSLQGLDLEGESSSAAILLKHLLLGRQNKEVYGFCEFHWKRSVTESAGVELFSSTVRSLVYGLSYTKFEPASVLFLNSYFTSGFDQWGGDKSFFKFNFDLARQQRLTKKYSLLIKGGGQISDTDQLPSTEQFQIGGMTSIRGFSGGARVGDDGYFISLELHAPLPFFQEVAEDNMSWLFFVDHGAAYPFKGNNQGSSSDDYLTSTGVGVLFNLKNNYSGRLNLAVPLVDREEDQSDLLIHFFLMYSY